MLEVHYILYFIHQFLTVSCNFKNIRFYYYLIIWIITCLIHCLKMCFDYLSLMQSHFVLAAFATAQLIVF